MARRSRRSSGSSTCGTWRPFAFGGLGFAALWYGGRHQVEGATGSESDDEGPGRLDFTVEAGGGVALHPFRGRSGRHFGFRLELGYTQGVREVVDPDLAGAAAFRGCSHGVPCPPVDVVDARTRYAAWYLGVGPVIGF